MKANRTYQNNLANQRWNSTLISCSWSVFYNGEYICGAHYDDTEILSVCFPCGLVMYSKSMDVMKKYVREYQAGRLEA